jgi:hypothetical protein
LDAADGKDLVGVGFEQLQDAAADGYAFVDPEPVGIAVLCRPIGRHVHDGEMRQRLARAALKCSFTSITTPPVP